MTQTPPPHDTESEERTTEPGVDRANLRSYERLRRSITDRKIAGVAGGLGRHLNIDPTIIRVLLVVLVFFGGAGLVLYGAAWLIVPEEGSDNSVVDTTPSTRNALLIVAAVVAGMLLVGDSWGGFGFPWPLFLLALIAFAVLVGRDRSGRPTPAAPAQEQHAQEQPAQEYAAAGEQHAAPAGPPAPAYEWQPPSGSGGTYAYPQPEPAPSQDRGPKLFGITLALVALALGVLGFVDATWPGAVADAAYPALALTVIGTMLVVGAFVGRAGGLIFLGIVAALALAGASVTGGNWAGERSIFRTPTSADAVATDYSVTAGQIALDLTEVEDLENLDGRTVSLEATAGEVLVRVPEGLDVDVESDIAWAGEISIDGVRNDGGGGVSLDRTIDGGTGVPELALDIDLTVGHIEVVQEDAA
jgi:phage shock protein PspC (stress-responsive transcriptional regulator)